MTYKCYLVHSDEHVYHILVLSLCLGVYLWGPCKFGKWKTILWRSITSESGIVQNTDEEEIS